MGNESRAGKLQFTNPNLDLNSNFDSSNNTSVAEIVLDKANKITDKIEGLETLNKELERDIYIDKKTGLLNDNALELAKQKFNAVKINHPLFVFSLDLNRLKFINDNVNYAAGDELLKKMAFLLKGSFPSGDDIYRANGNGGDEFIVICKPSTNENIIDKVIDRLNTKTEEINSTIEEKNIFGLSFAVGGVKFDPNKHTDLNSVIEDADILMKNNKLKMKLADPSLER